jgi:hypothetical protein
MATRKELVSAVSERYRVAGRSDKARILDELVVVAGYHRKHAIRLLGARGEVSRPRAGTKRLYDEAVQQALIVLWEASDRLCGKRLKVAIPPLIAAMERHAHLDLDPAVKERLLQISAASIDRLLRATRKHISGKRRQSSGIGIAIRRSVPVRTFAGWDEPPPGFFEVDMVEHCGGVKVDGDFVHTLVLTDTASQWTECIAMPMRSQDLVVAAFDFVAGVLPFAMSGVDTDNDSAFINTTVIKYCRQRGLLQTRSRPYHKNDQAWVEQKNGAIVRKLVGYGRLRGIDATQILARLYAQSRLYVNFFQPSFKLKSKTRDGARVAKVYHPPCTPYLRLMESSAIEDAAKDRLREIYSALDPVALLADIRLTQRVLHEMPSGNAKAESTRPASPDLKGFLEGLATAWKSGEVRPTHRKTPKPPRSWRTRNDPVLGIWPACEACLAADPTLTAKELLKRVSCSSPGPHVGARQLRTLQRRVKRWRAERAAYLLFGQRGSRVEITPSTTATEAAVV